ncbi:MAG: sulfur carrier protein ThiS [Nitrospinae bacterium]|nr:sulfur carrier protein ThiS [Nitrospinota bacterium]MDA1109576.1 sulfur carrier protein ThiS [Nitrospinota bacterium]
MKLKWGISVKLTINGEEREIHSSNTVTELVEELKIVAPNIAVAVNHQVVPRSQYPTTAVQEGDTIEIVHAVGGGV